MGIRHLLVLLAACGRIGFDAAAGHDEDGDGVRDEFDVCPHLADDQGDGDADGVGDACDPEPAIARQQLLVFATMQPGDQPFAVDDTFAQLADAIEYDGSGSAGIAAPAGPYTNIRVQLGATIVQVLGGDGIQHQVALRPRDPAVAAHDFVEFNEILPDFSRAQVSHFDGAQFAARTAQDLPMHVRAGDLALECTAVAGGAMTLTGGWAGEPYALTDTAAAFSGGTIIEIDINHLVVDLRYLWAVVW